MAAADSPTDKDEDENESVDDYDRETREAIARLEADSHDMFTVIEGRIGGGDDLDTSMLSSIDASAVSSADHAGLCRFSMLHAMFEMMIDQSNISRRELATLLASDEIDRTVVGERTDDL